MVNQYLKKQLQKNILRAKNKEKNMQSTSKKKQLLFSNLLKSITTQNQSSQLKNMILKQLHQPPQKQLSKQITSKKLKIQFKALVLCLNRELMLNKKKLNILKMRQINLRYKMKIIFSKLLSLHLAVPKENKVFLRILQNKNFKLRILAKD